MNDPWAMRGTDVRAAAQRLAGQIRHTPALHVPALDRPWGSQLVVKAENLQYMGSFKARGAMHMVGRLANARRSAGLVTYSSGNHAAAVAWTAKQHGVPATIVMPTDAPSIKVDAVRAMGAELVFAGTTSAERQRAAEALAQRSGGTIVPPFDHADIIAGAGTATLELIEQAQEHGGLDALVVPVGGGGLIAGACLVAREFDIPVYGVEPHGCDPLARSLQAGQHVHVDPGPTLADGLKPVRIGTLNLRIIAPVLAGTYRVDDDDLRSAMAALAVHGKLVAEPSGVAALAVALREPLGGDPPPRRIGVLVSGGNVDPSVLAEALRLELR